jgi:hypothetical protein
MGSIEPLAYTYASLFGITTEADYPYARYLGHCTALHCTALHCTALLHQW